MNQHKIKVSQAAKIMGVSEQFIRIGLQRGELPIGYAVKMSRFWTYYIPISKFQEYTGINVDEFFQNHKEYS